MLKSNEALLDILTHKGYCCLVLTAHYAETFNEHDTTSNDIFNFHSMGHIVVLNLELIPKRFRLKAESKMYSKIVCHFSNGLSILVGENQHLTDFLQKKLLSTSATYVINIINTLNMIQLIILLSTPP